MNRGFTLLELILAAAIFALISSFGFLVSLDFYRSYVFDNEVKVLVSLLQRARSQSLNNMGQSSHGFAALSSQYILFDRADFIKSEAGDLLYPRDAQITISWASAPKQIVFEQLSGNAREQEIVLSDGKRSRKITVSKNGRIVYE